MLERDIEKYLCKRVTSVGGMCKKWVSPGWSGVPDRIIFLPNGRILFAELKAPGKEERVLQNRRQEQLRQMGFVVYSSVDSFEKVDGIIKDILTGADARDKIHIQTYEV